jgi:hypothetical protein
MQELDHPIHTTSTISTINPERQPRDDAGNEALLAEDFDTCDDPGELLLEGRTVLKYLLIDCHGFCRVTEFLS